MRGGRGAMSDAIARERCARLGERGAACMHACNEMGLQAKKKAFTFSPSTPAALKCGLYSDMPMISSHRCTWVTPHCFTSVGNTYRPARARNAIVTVQAQAQHSVFVQRRHPPLQRRRQQQRTLRLEVDNGTKFRQHFSTAPKLIG